MDVSRDPVFRDLGTNHPRSDDNKRLDSFKVGSLDLGVLTSPSQRQLSNLLEADLRGSLSVLSSNRDQLIKRPCGSLFQFCVSVFLATSFTQLQKPRTTTGSFDRSRGLSRATSPWQRGKLPTSFENIEAYQKNRLGVVAIFILQL